MEDIICPECGRPNLSEAKKCWYCQTELVSLVETPPEDSKLKQDGATPPKVDSPSEPSTDEEQELPEWLARIRKKIEEERGPEEELPYWKQKDIFGGEKKISQKKKEKRGLTPPGPADQQDQNQSVQENNLLASSKADSDINLEELSDDLPEGFTKF